MIAHRQVRTKEEVDSLLQSIMKEALRRFPALIPYQHVLEFVFTAFYRQDGLIFFKENEEGAYISPDMVYGQYVYHLNIGILNRLYPTTVLWSVLHEYGHILQETRTEAVRLDPVLTLARETDAWDKAEQLLPQFHLPGEMLNSFQQFREERLDDYRAKLST